jgi:hypothetical protein
MLMPLAEGKLVLALEVSLGELVNTRVDIT